MLPAGAVAYHYPTLQRDIALVKLDDLLFAEELDRQVYRILSGYWKTQQPKRANAMSLIFKDNGVHRQLNDVGRIYRNSIPNLGIQR